MASVLIDSVLTSTKKLLGFDADYTEFDVDITMLINGAFSALHQVGATPPNGFRITGPDERWGDLFLGVTNADMVQIYIYMKVKAVFDPPATSFGLDAQKKQLDEYEWRLNVMEYDFNPNAARPSGSPKAFWWDLTGGIDFPAEADNGDMGYDSITGQIWRNSK